jgi:hypothetical protein
MPRLPRTELANLSQPTSPPSQRDARADRRSEQFCDCLLQGMLLTLGYLSAAALLAIQMRERSPAGVRLSHQEAVVARRSSIGVGDSGAVNEAAAARGADGARHDAASVKLGRRSEAGRRPDICCTRCCVSHTPLAPTLSAC